MQALNRVQLVGVLPRNPEMRYTPKGTPVASFTILTYRGWDDDSGKHQESPEYSNVVVWSKLAEICNQLLLAGSKVFVEGRLQTRSWEDQSGVKHYKTEIIADDMVLLSGRADTTEEVPEDQVNVPSKECLNRVQVIGNLARDPELRYLNSGTAVCTFVIATNRSWVNSSGDRQESTEFHNVVCWNELADEVAKGLEKGQKALVEGRLQNRSWEGDDGVKRYKTEIVGSYIVTSTIRQELGVSSGGGGNNKPKANFKASTASDNKQSGNEDQDDFDIDSAFDDIFTDSPSLVDDDDDDSNKNNMAF